MNECSDMICQRFNALCVRSVLTFQAHFSLFMFLLGLALLGAGLSSFSAADINREGAPPSPANFGVGAPASPANFFQGAPAAFNRFPLPGFARAPQAAFAEAPEVTPVNPDIGGEAAIDVAPENLDIPYDDTLQRNAVGNLFKFIEGSFGALVMTAAGIGAIIAAAMGAYKAAVGILVVAIAAFILRALVSLFFGTDYDEFGGLNGGGAVGDLP